MKKYIRPEVAVQMAKSQVKDWHKEHLIGVYLGTLDEIKGLETISIGTLNSTMIYPRDVYRPAISKGAAGVVLLHNHPNSDVKPSPDDLKYTRELIVAGKILDVNLIDSIVFWKGKRFHSMRIKNNNLWNFKGVNKDG